MATFSPQLPHTPHKANLTRTTRSESSISSSSSGGYTAYCTSCNACSTCSTLSSSSSSSSSGDHHRHSPDAASQNISSNSLFSESESALVTSTSEDMQLLNEKEETERELRSKIGDDKFIEQQRLLLRPGIENSQKRFKVHQFTKSAMMLPDFGDYARIKPLIDGLVGELDPTDFLGCSAAMEILAEVASSRQENIRYFERNGLLHKVYDLFKFTKSNPDLGIPHIACIRFFGYLSTADPDALAKFPLFTEDVFDAVNRFDAFDMGRRKLAFETLAIITTTSAAKQFLCSKECPYNMDKAMNHLGAVVLTGAGIPELKAAYLDSIRTIFDSFDPQSPLESPVILRNWFTQLGAPFAKLLFECLKTPIDSVQNAALQLLLALVRHKWAPAHFFPLDGFFPFLLDRELHFTFIGYQLKHDIVCRIINSHPTQIEAPMLEELRHYAAMGPYAAPEKVAIDTEDIS